MRSIDYSITSAINNKIKTSSVITGVSPEAVIEWNYNNCLDGDGYNLVNAGDDIYSFGVDERLYFVDNFAGVQYPKTEGGIALRETFIEAARQIARPWREPAFQTVPILTNNPNHNRLYSNSTTSLIPMSKDGYAVWSSQTAKNSQEFFKCNGITVADSTPRIPAMPQQNIVQIIGFVTQSPATTNGTVRLLLKTSAPLDSVNKKIVFEKSIVGSEWDGSKSFSAPPGRYTITGIGSGYIPDVVWGTTRGGQNVIKFGQHRDNSIPLGSRIKPQSSSQPGIWWNSANGYATVTSVKRNTLNAPVGKFWVDVGFSPQVGDGIVFTSQQGVIYTYYHWVDITADNVPDIVVSDSLGIKQITGVQTINAHIVEAVTNEQELNKKIADVAQTGGTVVIDANINLTNPLIVPSNVRIDAQGYTISASASFNSRYDYLIYTYNPSTYVTTASCAGDTNQITVVDPSQLVVGQNIQIEYSQVVASIGGVSTDITQRVLITGVITNKSGTTITLNRVIPDEFSNKELYLVASSDKKRGNIEILNGTWNLSAPSSELGFISLRNANQVSISGVSVTSDAATTPLINLSGCTNITVKSSTLDVSGVAIRMESNPFANLSTNQSILYDTCYNILVKECSITADVGIESYVNAASDNSNHQNIKVYNNDFLCGTNATILQNCSHTFIDNNSISGAGGGVAIISVNARCQSNLISSNDFNTSSEEISLVGQNAESGLSAIAIKNNTGIETGVEINNAVFVSWINNSDSLFQPVLPPAGTIGPNEYVVLAAVPTTIYKKSQGEVVKYRKDGKRITVWTTKELGYPLAGEYIAIENVHPQIDGARRVLGASFDGTEYRITLFSNSNGIIPEQYADPDNQSGYAIVPEYVPMNSVTVKFDTTYGVPSTGIIQVLSKEGWQNVFSFSDSDLTNYQEKDLSIDTNIKSLRIFKNSSWSTTEGEMSIADAISAGAVRVVLQTATEASAILCVAELSGRLMHDVSQDIIDFNVSKSLGASSDYNPVGVSSANTGSLSLSNDNLRYSTANDSSPFAGLFKKSAVCHTYLDYGVARIKIGTMVIESWDSNMREDATLNLIDKSIILSNADAPNMFLYETKTNSLTTISITKSLKALLNAKGFGNIKFFGSDHLLKAFYSKSSQNLWEIIQELLEPYQAAAYFDEFGTLQIMFRDYIFPEVYYAPGKVFFDSPNYKIELAPGYSPNISVGMIVSDDNSPSTNATVTNITGNIVTISNALPTGRYDLRFSSGRAGNNYVVGRNSDIPTHLDSSSIFSVGPSDYYNFDLDSRFNPDELNNSSSHSNYSRKFTKKNEFYISRIKRVAGLVEAKIDWAVPLAKVPVNGDSMFFDGIGALIDSSNSSVTVVSSSDGESAVVQYTLSGSETLPLTSSVLGESGYRSGNIYYRLSNIFPGKRYIFAGKVAKSANFNLSISADTTISSQFESNEIDSWQRFEISFVSDDNSPEIVVSVSGMDFNESFYMMDESIKLAESLQEQGSDVWKDEIISFSQEKTDSASSVDVFFKSLNPYSERSTGLDGQREIGKNQELWKMEDYILPVFELLSIDTQNGVFTFNASGMNEGAISSKPDNTDKVFAWLPYSGKFTIENSGGTEYEYEGLEAEIYGPADEGEGSPYTYVVKNNEDYIDARNLNLGLPLRWTGRGFMKRTYPDPVFGTNEAFISPIINNDVKYDNSDFTIVRTPLPQEFNRIRLAAGNSMNSIYFKSNITNVNTVGAVMSLKNISSSSAFGLVLNGSQESADGAFIGIKTVDKVMTPFLAVKTINGDVDIAPSEVSFNQDKYTSYFSSVDGLISSGDSLSIPSVYKFEANLSNDTLYFYINSDLVAMFDVSGETFKSLLGVQPGVFLRSASGYVSAIYWASQSQAYDYWVTPDDPDIQPTAAEVYEIVKRDNFDAPQDKLSALISQYQDASLRGATALGQIQAYRRNSIPHQYFAFYGVQQSSDVAPPRGTLISISNPVVGRMVL